MLQVGPVQAMSRKRLSSVRVNADNYKKSDVESNVPLNTEAFIIMDLRGLSA